MTVVAFSQAGTRGLVFLADVITVITAHMPVSVSPVSGSYQVS